MKTEKETLPTQLESEIQKLWQRIKKPKDKALIKLLLLLGKSSESLPLEELEEMLAESDAQPAKAKKEELPRALTDEELARFRTAITNERDALAVELALEAALRESEILCLERDDVLWEERVIRVRGKGGTHKEVPITRHLHEVLDRAMRARPASATHPRVLWNKRNPAEMLKARQTLWKIVQRIAHRAGITRAVRFHDLRHTCLTKYYRSTGDLKGTQELARHKKIELTANTYVGVTTEDLREKMEQANRAPWWMRWWKALKPKLRKPDFFKPKSTLHIGEIVGREEELSEMRKVLRTSGRHCLLVGDPDVGRKTLLKAIYAEWKDRAYEIDVLKPAKGALSELYEAMKKDGLPVGELPSDTRSTKVWLDAIRPATKDKQITLFIYDSDDPDIKILRQLGCIIFTSTIPEKKQEVRKALFTCREIEIEPLDKAASFELGEKAMDEEQITVPNKKDYLNHIARQSGGLPKAILGLISETRATGDLEPEYLDRGKERSAYPIVCFILTTSAILRYSASSIGLVEWKIFFAIICLIAGVVALVCKIYKD